MSEHDESAAQDDATDRTAGETTRDQPPTPTGRAARRPWWLRGRRPVVAGITVAALVGGWALSSTPAAQAAADRAASVSAGLDRATSGASAGGTGLAEVTSSLDRMAGGTAGAAAPGSVAPKNTAPKDAAFQRALDALVSRDGVPGVEAFVRDADGKVRSYTAGVGDLATKAPVPADGQVRIGSNTKTFTAATVLSLVGKGTIDLDASVESYLPGVVHGQGLDASKITVRNLLQQTSGLPDYDSVVIGKSLVDIQHTYYEPRQALDAALTQPAAFAPGTSWGYSNTNYLVAGLIVQRATGRPIGEEITKQVIEPAGLEHTYWPNVGVQSVRGAHPHGYVLAKGAEPADVTVQDPSLGWAAGQLISTPSDLSTFNRSLLDGKLLEPAQQEELLSTVAAPGFEPSGEWSYGLGLARHTTRCGVEAWGHGGDIPGFETRNLTTRDGRSAVVAITTLPSDAAGVEHVNAAVEDAICN